ncbi:MAG: hypothetical protein J6C37_10560 [Roseburia sp.]|nr:hypothetical protein [Roseburia sp.]
MEQVSFFLAEYSVWIGVAFGVLVMLLLAVTLHRIKKLGKRMDTLTHSIRSGREAWIDFDETVSRKNMAEEKTAELRKANQKSADGGMSAGRQRAGKEIPAEAQREMAPDELLNAVLDEVFP